jgi:hypothetical protein
MFQPLQPSASFILALKNLRFTNIADLALNTILNFISFAKFPEIKAFQIICYLKDGYMYIWHSRYGFNIIDQHATAA